MSDAAKLNPAFSSASQRLMNAGGEAISASRVEAVRLKQEHVTEVAQRHFERHGEKWVATRYADLLRKDLPARELRPPGLVEDRSARLLRAARHMVARKHAATLQRIDRAASKMLGVSREGALSRG